MSAVDLVGMQNYQHSSEAVEESVDLRKGLNTVQVRFLFGMLIHLLIIRGLVF